MLSFRKSSDPDFSNDTKYDLVIIHKLDLLLKEQVQQRLDLSTINSLIKTLMADSGIQKQVDDYFDERETSPQTDTENTGTD